jgi:polyisoprenoid-binding protein YceI
MESAIIKGVIQFQPMPLVGVNSSAATNTATQPSSAQAGITIPVRSFKSGKASMDELFLEAMHANTHRDVNYNLLALTPSTAPSAEKGLNRYSSFGTLTINGIERECTLEVALDQLDRGGYRFRGEHNLKMSDYGVIPPETRIPGLEPITTGDDVVVRFEWVVGPAG